VKLDLEFKFKFHNHKHPWLHMIPWYHKGSVKSKTEIKFMDRLVYNCVHEINDYASTYIW